jgi:hypothetical protein
MGEKIYSIVLKGQRFDFTQTDLDSIKKGTTTTEGGRKFVHISTKNGRLDVLQEEFDKVIAKFVPTETKE